ncbi:hypothetical protein NPIL_290501 [Nephila pilipes]|uniref:Uncharacterized protein n=1 Tax=Nephila pilipes TaxID=299642 RepID=A0A8X6NG88_NEPPI|nr:hypothetical protein NPIL_290501 [Nephila pilipes]
MPTFLLIITNGVQYDHHSDVMMRNIEHIRLDIARVLLVPRASIISSSTTVVAMSSTCCSLIPLHPLSDCNHRVPVNSNR